MDEVLVMRVCEFFRCPVIDFWEDKRCQGRRLGGSGGSVLGKNGGSIGYAGTAIPCQSRSTKYTGKETY